MLRIIVLLISWWLFKQEELNGNELIKSPTSLAFFTPAHFLWERGCPQSQEKTCVETDLDLQIQKRFNFHGNRSDMSRFYCSAMKRTLTIQLNQILKRRFLHLRATSQICLVKIRSQLRREDEDILIASHLGSVWQTDTSASVQDGRKSSFETANRLRAGCWSPWPRLVLPSVGLGRKFTGTAGHRRDVCYQQSCLQASTDKSLPAVYCVQL